MEVPDPKQELTRKVLDTVSEYVAKLDNGKISQDTLLEVVRAIYNTTLGLIYESSSESLVLLIAMIEGKMR